jgi:tetratricopeptide (TPR) repeat protein
MGDRRSLVISSQCVALGKLSFIPEVAHALDKVLRNPALGCCLAALDDGRSILLDPTLPEMDGAIAAAIARASRDRATLFLAFVGHGEYSDRDFYFLPKDGEYPPDSKSDFLLGQRLEEMLRAHDHLDGLVLLIDACHSGLVLEGAAARWVRLVGRAGRRFEVLTGADDRMAADGCFTRTVSELLKVGRDDLGDRVGCGDVKKVLLESCKKQTAQHMFFDGRRVQLEGDEGLWLSRNASRDAPWMGTAVADEIERLTAWFQPTRRVEDLITWSKDERCVSVIGISGQGKSSLVAALASPHLNPNTIPHGFMHGIVFLSQASTAEAIASTLARQLVHSVDGFDKASTRFRLKTMSHWERLDALEREIIGPLQSLSPRKVVRIAIDGVDRVPAATVSRVTSALEHFITAPDLDHVRLVVTGLLGTRLPSTRVLLLDRAPDDDVVAYLERRGIPPQVRPIIVERASGNWLQVRLLADAQEDPSRKLPASILSPYELELQRAGADRSDVWQFGLRPVLTALAAAGVGPALPIRLLCGASVWLGGAGEPGRVRDVLALVSRLLVRAEAGTDQEHDGLFHSSLAEYLLGVHRFSVDGLSGHRALAAAIQKYAPMEKHDPKDPLHHYAARAEAEHLWAGGDHSRALTSLELRASYIPKDNRARWRSWRDRSTRELGRDDLRTLITRYQLAYWTVEGGDLTKGCRLFAQLLVDYRRLVGDDHRGTLRTRFRIARCSWQMGEFREALEIASGVVSDQERRLGRDDVDTLSSRNLVGACMTELGDRDDALNVFRALLNDQTRVLGADAVDTLRTRNNIAVCTAQVVGAVAAVGLLQPLLADEERALGRDHPLTLLTRWNVGRWTGEAGNALEASRVLGELVVDRGRLLGPDHPDVLSTRSELAKWTAKTGNVARALSLYSALLRDQERVYGSDHEEALRTRHRITLLGGGRNTSPI